MKANLKAVPQIDPLNNLTDRLDRATAVLIFMSNATSDMLDAYREMEIPNPEENSLGADIIFSWLIKEMQDIADCNGRQGANNKGT